MSKKQLKLPMDPLDKNLKYLKLPYTGLHYTEVVSRAAKAARRISCGGCW